MNASQVRDIHGIEVGVAAIDELADIGWVKACATRITLHTAG